MKIEADWTYETKTFKLKASVNDLVSYSNTLKGCVMELLKEYPYLEHLDCFEHTIDENQNGETYDCEFSFYIDEIDEIREESPHLFV